jgi:hypothetical protein
MLDQCQHFCKTGALDAVAEVRTYGESLSSANCQRTVSSKQRLVPLQGHFRKPPIHRQ